MYIVAKRLDGSRWLSQYVQLEGPNECTEDAETDIIDVEEILGEPLAFFHWGRGGSPIQNGFFNT